MATTTAVHPRQEELDDQEEECPAKSIDLLGKHGITATDIKKFKEFNYNTIESVLMNADKFLLQIKGITEKKLEEVKKACKKEVPCGFSTGKEVKLRRAFIKKITTGSAELDKIMGGGIETQSITEIYGEFRTGKTQWVHTLCVTGMLPKNMGGGGGKVILIDTEGTFRPNKITPIAERFGVSDEEILDNLITARPYNSDAQMQMINELPGLLMEQGPFSLLIIDSVTALFRVDYVGRGELSVRQQNIGQMLSKIIKIASEFNIGVLLTNQVMSNPDGMASFVPDPKKPVGGHVLAHASTTRIELKKARGDCRSAKIVDSPDMPEAEATFQITDKGICDPDS